MWLNAAQTPNIVVLKIQYQSLYNLVFHVFHVHPCIQKRTRLMDAVGHCIDEHRSCQSTLITARVWWTNKRRKVIRQDIRWCGRWWKIFYILHLKFQVVYRQRNSILFTLSLCLLYFLPTMDCTRFLLLFWSVSFAITPELIRRWQHYIEKYFTAHLFYYKRTKIKFNSRRDFCLWVAIDIYRNGALNTLWRLESDECVMFA